MEWLRNQVNGFPDWHPGLQALVRVLIFVVPVLILVPGCIWWERRLLSWMQDRIGPNRVPTFTFPSGKKLRLFGLLQPIADGVKLFMKEDTTPVAVDKVLYFIAPALALFPAFALGATIPWAADKLLTPVADVNIGILYILAISSLGVYGVVLAGYASNNKYSLMGGLRSSAQLISYELAMGMSLASVALVTGSLKLTEMVGAQEQPLWGSVSAIANWNIFTPFGFVAAVVFLICAVAETNRAPFDLPEAENEIIAGYHTEYSSMKFAVFFMGEYAAMLIFSGVFATVFLGGYNLLPFRWDAMGLTSLGGILSNPLIGALVFLGKCTVGLTFFIWLRATLPRLRYDQLMSLGWKSLLPLAVANFILVAFWIFETKMYGVSQGWVAWLGAAAVLSGLYFSFSKAFTKDNSLEVRTIDLVSGDDRTVEMVQ